MEDTQPSDRPSNRASDWPEEAPRSRGRKRRFFGGVGVTLVILLGIAYWQRISLANRVVRDQLGKYDVPVSYSIKEIGLRTQRLENIVIGDPANPDLTAKLVEVDVSIGFTGATIKQVRASGVRVRGRYTGDTISFGALDKFRDPTSKKPFEFPDLGVDLKDAQLTMDTPWGRIGAGLDGKGQLRNRFAGNLALRAPTLNYGDCATTGARFDGRYAIEQSQPNVIGPILAETIKCRASGFAADKANIAADIRLSKNFDRWLGDVGYSAKSLQSGSMALTLPRGTLNFDGSKTRTNFTASIDQAGYKGAPLTLRKIIADAKGHVDYDAGGLSVTARGNMRIAGGVLDKSTLSSIDGLSGQTKDTPVGPLIAKMGPALRRAASGFDGNLRYDAHIVLSGASSLLLDGVVLSSQSGARITQNGLLSLGNKGNSWFLASPLSLALSGGDLPTTKLVLRQGRGGAWNGMMDISPFAANGSSVAVSNLAFAGRPGAVWSFNGDAKLTGPLPGGSVSGLALPIDGRWDGRNVSLYQSCQTIGFESAKLSNLYLARQSFRLCPDAGKSIFSSGNGNTRLAANLPNFAFKGALGSSPMMANSANVRFNLGEGFKASQVKVALGRSDSLTAFDIATLNGTFGVGGMNGNLAGATGRIGNVPLLLEDAGGKWSYRKNILALEGALRVTDAEQVDRFQPMMVPDALVNLENGIITAIGSIHEPKTGRTIADVDIRHQLSNTTGRALLSVDGLRFDDALQPEMLTPLTLGVVANLKGVVSGDGRINWDGTSVISGGRFATSSLDLAAAFGPVEGLSSEIVFTDLLALETGPAQQARLASVNPGIAALNGRVSYQLLPGKKVGIEGGRWPFAGGELVLEPTVLDFAVTSERRLTFKVVGVDAEKFLAQYEFDNLRVSGVFDGTLPMVFNAEGGRIVGGELTSRAGGGELSYLGELSYKDMGVFANYAFQALKSIRYNDLTIGVNGDLGGEIITNVSFSGVQQGSLAKRNFITRQLANIPIKFNISITAEFLKLIGSIRSIYDPAYNNQTMLPDLIARQEGQAPVTGETPPPTIPPPKLPAPETKPQDE
jgi:translocation and assembly module TamB